MPLVPVGSCWLCSVDVGLDNCGGIRVVVSPVVRNLASALLQIEQMIDHRYFEAPLGL